MRYSRWDQVLTLKETNEILLELASVHCSRINSTHEREYVASCIAGDHILSLCDYAPAYSELSVSDAINLRQISAFFQKRRDVEVGIDKRRATIDRFIDSERLCLQTNYIFELKRRGEFFFPSRVESILHTAQRKIASILGTVPSLEEIKPRFGPGATTNVVKRKASARRKLGMVPACSEELLPLIRECLESVEGWCHSLYGDETEDPTYVPVEIHDGKLVFVPKSYKTHRSVVVEPCLNSMFQLGIGEYISGRLRRAGVDLHDQTLNQRLARVGSLTGALATLDLSNASDTIARELVYDLLPIDWAIFLSHFRTGHVTYEGYRMTLSKFSSMGNGFTFPLESLIFYALAYACTEEGVREHSVAVYGDDIIVPTEAASCLIEVLNAVGFVVNSEKSFTSGPFRESCGADYLKGFDIRPCYIKDSLACYDLFRLHNFYVRRGELELAAICLNHIDPCLRRYGPDGYGDGHLIGDNVGLVPHKRKHGWSGYVFETYTFRSRKDFEVLPGDRVYPSYCSYERSLGDVLARSSTTSLRELALATAIVDSPSHEVKRGLLGVSIPGVKGINLIKIYVLSA